MNSRVRGIIPGCFGSPYACGGPRSVYDASTSFGWEGASYTVYDSDNWMNGVQMPWKQTADSDWKFERMSITAYCESLWSCSVPPPR